MYPWHPRNVAIARAKVYCQEKGIRLVVARPDGEAVLPARARLSGFPNCFREPTCYGIPEVLACATAARSIGVPPETARIVVAYLGEEVSVSARLGGTLVDSSDPVACEGPFGLTSCGTAPATAFVSYIRPRD
jgi:butyrate kinase